MKIDMSKVSYDGREFPFGSATLTIRPYPQSRTDIAIKDGALVFSGSSGRDMFVYCLTKWEGVVGADDQPLKMSDDVKRKIYDFKFGAITDEKGEQVSMSDFVIRKAREMTDEIAADTKN